MKILVVVSAIGTVYGGPSKSVLELAQALTALGIVVDVVTTNANGSTLLDVPLNVWIQDKTYKIRYFSYWTINEYKFSYSLTRWVFKHIMEYDLVHTNGLFSYPILATHLACQWHQFPYIITPRGMLEPWALAYKSYKKWFYFKLFEKSALDKASAVQMLAVSEVERAKVLNFKAPMVVVPNGIHPQEFATFSDPELFYEKFPNTRYKTLIIFLGRIDPKKGLDLLAAAFYKVQKQFPSIHLVVAGVDSTNFLPVVQDYFTKLDCLESVTFTGMLVGELKYAALAVATIYVAPSYSEGFSMSVLEGMATGLPCVITTGCNFPEAGAAQAAKIVNINSDEIAEALLQCLRNPQEAKEMGDRARKFVFENYTWERVATKMVEVYRTILNSTQ